MPVKLNRIAPGLYKACVTAKDSGMPPIELTVAGPDPVHKCWIVITADTEQYFAKLSEARRYVNTFFEPAKLF